jgi:rubrerythrin
VNRRALLVAGAALALAPRRAWASGDDLGYLLAIEQLQVDLYDRARELPLTGRAAALAGRFRNHEAEHLARLNDAIKAKAPDVSLPSFSNQAGFLRAAQRIEALAVSAYNGAIPTVRDHALRAELAAIAQTEGRHAAAIRQLRGKPPAPRAFDLGAQADPVERALANLRG